MRHFSINNFYEFLASFLTAALRDLYLPHILGAPSCLPLQSRSLPLASCKFSKLIVFTGRTVLYTIFSHCMGTKCTVAICLLRFMEHRPPYRLQHLSYCRNMISITRYTFAPPPIHCGGAVLCSGSTTITLARYSYNREQAPGELTKHQH